MNFREDIDSREGDVELERGDIRRNRIAAILGEDTDANDGVDDTGVMSMEGRIHLR